MAVRPLGFSLAAALALSVALPASLPAVPYLVKDLHTGPTGPGVVDRPVFLGDGGGIGPGVSYFTAFDPAHGDELWRSDGTPGGTERLTDICAGRCSSLPDAITVHAGRVFFKANDGFSGDELWVSDGTPGSERRVRDLCPGSCSAYPSRVEKAGEHLLFIPQPPLGEVRFELWRTDGTRDGTVRVKVLCTAGCSGVSPLIALGERALFLVDNQFGQGDLWVTDGTAAGTRPLRELGRDLGFIGGYQSVWPGDGLAWVLASDGLWRTDGTAAGTFLLKRYDELTSEPDRDYVSNKVVWHGLLFGFLSEGGVFRSDGTPEGTFRIAQDVAGPVIGFALLDSELLFQIVSSDSSILWSSRGTADTTGPKLVLDTVEAPSNLTGLDGERAVFVAGYNEFFDRTQLWVTDGTAAGTRPLALPPGFVFSGALFATGDGRALFVRGPWEDTVWITDGTEAGTREVRSFGDVPGSSGPQQQAALGGKLVFSARTSDEGAPLHVSDGTAAGTGLLSEKAHHAVSFVASGDRLWFTASRSDGVFPGIWATDGTPAGTTRVKGRTTFFNPAPLGGQILFGGFSNRTGIELWKINGLTGDIGLVRDIDRFFVDTASGSGERCEPESSFPVPGGILGGRLLLAADDGKSGRELWASDGTPAGTVPLRDINPGRSSYWPEPCDFPPAGSLHRHDTGLSSDPEGFVILGSVALFTADDGLRGRELWITNGTSPGTRRVADLVPGPRGSAPHDLVRFQDRVYFLAANRGQGESLWQTDGTARGTTRVLDLTLDGLPSWGRNLTVAAGRLFFTVYNEATGAELWASTGNASDIGGTGLVIDLNPGPGHSSAQFLTAVGGVLLFTADDGLTGLEAWRTDGTAAGTVNLGDIAPGRDASSPGPFTALPTVVMTGADDGVHGREPWAIPKAEIVQATPGE